MIEKQVHRGRKNHRIIHEHISKEGQVHIAGAVKTSESTMSRVVSNLQVFADTLAVCGLKVVPDDLVCYRQDYVDSLEAIAQEHFQMKKEMKDRGEYKPPLEFPEE